MDSDIILLEELRSKEPVELGRIARHVEVELGREPSAQGILIANEAVSRTHGKISSIGNYWIYEDLGSTNGSWADGEPLISGQVAILRSGTTLQLASTIIRITELDAAGCPVQTRAAHYPQRSLLVLLGDTFIAEYPVPEYGRALVIGGPGADLDFEGRTFNLASLIVERKGMHTTAYGSTPEAPAILCQIPMTKSTTLKDGDLISVGRYRVIYNEAKDLLSKQLPAVQSTEHWSPVARQQQGVAVSSSEDSDFVGNFLNKPAQSSLFGKPLEVQDQGFNVNETVRIDPATIPQRLGRDYHPSMRNMSTDRGGIDREGLEQRLVMVIGFCLLLALLILLVLWLFL